MRTTVHMDASALPNSHTPFLSRTRLIAAPMITPFCLQKSKRVRKCVVWQGDGFVVLGSASPEPQAAQPEDVVPPPALPALRRRSTTSTNNNDDVQHVIEMSAVDSPLVNNKRAAGANSRKRSRSNGEPGGSASAEQQDASTAAAKRRAVSTADANAVELLGDGGTATGTAATPMETATADFLRVIRREGVRAQARKSPGRARARH